MAALTDFHPRTLSVTAAASAGLPSLVRDAEGGADLVVERHGRAVAAVIGIDRLHRLAEAEADLRDLLLVAVRAADDSGERTELGEVLATLGYDRDELAAELDADIAAGRE